MATTSKTGQVIKAGQVDPQTEEEKKDDPKTIAAQGMVNSISRLRTAVRAMLVTMTNVAKNSGTGIKELFPLDWADIMHITTNTIGALERSWREEAKEKPELTEMYEITQCIIWDMHQMIQNCGAADIAHIMELMGDTSNSAWPVEIMWEKMCDGKRATHTSNLAVDPVTKVEKRKVKATYEKRDVVPGSASYVYPGFTSHFEWKHDASYYQSSIPFAAILQIIRELTKKNFLPSRMGTEYAGTLVFIYYELITATYEYYTNLNKYFIAEGRAPETKFDKILSLAPTSAESTSTSKFRWLDIVERAHLQAKNVCSNYYGGIEKSGSGNILGMNPEDLAKNPSHISAMLEKYLGIKGLGLDTLKRLPGFSGIVDTLNGLSTDGTPAAGAARSTPAL